MSPEEQLRTVGTRFRYHDDYDQQWRQYEIGEVNEPQTMSWCAGQNKGGGGWVSIADLVKWVGTGKVKLGWSDVQLASEQAPAIAPAEPGRCSHCREPNRYLPEDAVYLCTTCADDVWRREQFRERHGVSAAEARRRLGI